MRRFNDYFAAGMADRRFYESVGRTVTDDDLAEELRALLPAEHTVERDGIWARVRPSGLGPLPDHGWKIHLSAIPADARAALRAVCEEFGRGAFAFKCLRSTRFVRMSTARWWAPGQIGKVMAVYPRSAQECRELLARLAPVTAGIRGPYVLTDKRYEQSSLYYRYGEFKALGPRDIDGARVPLLSGPDGLTWEDERVPAYRRPPWVPELFEDGQAAAAGAGAPIRNYRVLRPLHYAGTGGTYLAERIDDGLPVVLKEARPHTGFADDGSDAQERLRREFDALNTLKGTGVAPEPIELFEEWEHLFLAEEYIDAMALITFIGSRHPLTLNDRRPETVKAYREAMEEVTAGVRHAVTTCHEAGLTYGDLSITNVKVDPGTRRVRLIDFEAARPVDGPQNLYPFTSGFAPARDTFTGNGRAFDLFGVDCVRLAMVMPRNTLRDLDSAALARSTRHAAGLLDEPVDDLLARLGLPDDPPRTDLSDPDAVVQGSVRFIEAVMSPDRDDRLFPADPRVFGTNPWSVAHGAAGVLRALHRINGRIPEAARAWTYRTADGLEEVPAGLYTGRAGVAWTLCDAGEPERALRVMDQVIRLVDRDPLGAADVMAGRAGVGMACLAVGNATGDTALLAAAERIGRSLLADARDTGTGLYWPDPRGGAQPVGYDYGSSGVALFLLYLYRATGDDTFLRVGRRALAHDLAQAIEHDEGMLSFPQRVGGGAATPYWSRGASGVGTALVRYCRVTGEDRLRSVLERLLRSRAGGLSVSPGLFTGMAGMANFGQDCADLLGLSEGRAIAVRACAAIASLACEQPEGIAFPGEGFVRFSTDYATGSAGIALTLHRVHAGGGNFNYTLDQLLPGGTDV
ncbi:class III lanthionine synthetase LanKC [Streptomyces sp. A012304]|uniref:class III lanthionine synthetase LanKC n=1 Tax=Streptomyces sp. A012304 TaxID=375446 RepID=UPI002230E4F1|nr:class III lanthionine synthetase LanKC [Streptomyces sp. A012304]GKQ40599.1 serine/threonine protein kinase [Streptomyces sp. A012304]